MSDSPQKVIVHAKSRISNFIVIFTLLLACLPFGHGKVQKESPLLITNARIFTMGQQGVLEKGMMLIENGIIKKIGSHIESPIGAEILDLSNRIIIPGLICANSYAGIFPRDAFSSQQESPESLVLDSIDRFDQSFFQAAQNGITSLYLCRPGFRMVGGQGAVIKVSPHAPHAYEVIKKAAALNLKLDHRPIEKTSSSLRLKQYYQLRQIFMDAEKYKEKFREAAAEKQKASNEAAESEPEKKTPVQTPDKDESKEILVQAMEGKLLVHIEARRENSILQALRLAEEFGLHIIVTKADEWPRILPSLTPAKTSLLIDPFSDFYRYMLPGGAHGFAASLLKRKGNHYHPEKSPPPQKRDWSALSRHKIPFALIPPHGSLHDARNLRYYASILVAEGLPPLEALRAVTAAPAEILGISNRVGSLEAGKDADFVVLDGEPLNTLSKIEAVFINGIRYENQPK